MNTSKRTVADIFRMSFDQYIVENKQLPLEHYKVANALMNCHTATLGGHVFTCNECGHVQIAYNSCRNRHCPSCQAAARFEWVEDRMKELLPVPYFHVVFTIPSQLNPFALRNKRIMYNILFKAASETLHTLAAREKYLGGNIGFIAVLHTWGQNLMDHPHLHCVVPSGGMSSDRLKWKSTPYESYLFPVEVVGRLFRGKFLALFRDAIKSGEIEYHGILQEYEINASSIGHLIDQLYKKEWYIYEKPPFSSPQEVLKYLGRYTHRVAISNNRITEVTDTTVFFHWKDYSDNDRLKEMYLSHHEFIRRFLLHVLPSGFVRIRYFGFLGQGVKKERLQLCRKLILNQSETPEDNVSECDEGVHLDKKERIVKWRCPICKKGIYTPSLKIPPLYRRVYQRYKIA
ncbi:MAG: IS91 family transposase [Clostridia bacterium]|nr:IS91 family transposase [Clostridia bacterium]